MAGAKEKKGGAIMHKLREFLKEEQGQATIEYIILAGGVVIAAVVIAGFYSSMAVKGMNRVNTTFDAATAKQNELIMEDVEKLANNKW